MQVFTTILYLTLVFWSSERFDHAVYISTINVIVLDNQLEVNIKVFEDDLRDALKNYYKETIDTSHVDFIEKVKSYFEKHLVISMGDVPIDWLNAEIRRVGDSYQYDMQSSHFLIQNEVKIKADYFLELFPTQQNILQLKHKDQRWYFIFKKGKEMFEVILSD